MHANAANIGNNLTEPNKANAIRLIEDLKKAVAAAAPRYGLGIAEVPFSNPADFVLVVAADAVCIVTNYKPLNNFPNQYYHEFPHSNMLEQVLRESMTHLGYTDPIAIQLPLYALNKDMVAGAIAPVVARICEEARTRMFLRNLNIPAGFKEYEPLLKTFLEDHPDPAKNVFVMMRFEPSEQHGKIYESLKSRASEYGFNCIRADERAYSDDLWQNVAVYMLGSQFGAAIFEEINERSFNPSVAIELGFMMAHRKRCLILKDKRMPRMPTDIVGKLYKEFDSYHIAVSVKGAVDNWMKDLGIELPTTEASPEDHPRGSSRS